VAGRQFRSELCPPSELGPRVRIPFAPAASQLLGGRADSQPTGTAAVTSASRARNARHRGRRQPTRASTPPKPIVLAVGSWRHGKIDQLESDDALMVTRLDRLARSTRDLLNTLTTITGKKAGFRSLGDTWADTTTSHGRPMLTVLAGLAEFERDLIRARTGEGRERAKARGVKMGRKPKLTPH
jgi:hypothetical protein